MPLLELEKAGLLSLIDAKIASLTIKVATSEDEGMVEGQHQDYYHRVYCEEQGHRGALKASQEIREMLVKYV